MDPKERLEKAKVEFERATKDFLSCRCYTYYSLVLITAEELLRASDAAAAKVNPSLLE